MIRHPPAQLLYLDRAIDRCPECGGWRWRKYCHLCNEQENNP